MIDGESLNLMRRVAIFYSSLTRTPHLRFNANPVPPSTPPAERALTMEASEPGLEIKNREAISALVRRMGLMRKESETISQHVVQLMQSLGRIDSFRTQQAADAQRILGLEPQLVALQQAVSEVALEQKALVESVRLCQSAVQALVGKRNEHPQLSARAKSPTEEVVVEKSDTMMMGGNAPTEDLERKVEILAEQVAQLKSVLLAKARLERTVGDLNAPMPAGHAASAPQQSVLDVIEKSMDAAVVDCCGTLRVCSSQVEVFSVPLTCNAAVVRSWICPSGKVVSCLVRYGAKGRSFVVTFESTEDAVRAVETLNGSQLGGAAVEIVPYVAAQVEAALPSSSARGQASKKERHNPPSPRKDPMPVIPTAFRSLDPPTEPLFRSRDAARPTSRPPNAGPEKRLFSAVPRASPVPALNQSKSAESLHQSIPPPAGGDDLEKLLDL
jgi:hypothetical protein